MQGEPDGGELWPFLEGSFLILTIWASQAGLVSVLFQTWPRAGLSSERTIHSAAVRAVFHFDTITPHPNTLLHKPMFAVTVDSSSLD